MDYTATLEATGGYGFDIWSVLSGALPAGLELSMDGVISGTPTAEGAATFRVEAFSISGNCDSRAYDPRRELNGAQRTTVGPSRRSCLCLPGAVQYRAKSLLASPRRGMLAPMTHASGPPPTPPTLLQRLKERKLVQWALAYLAGAWVVLEVASTLGDGLGWPDALFPALVAALAVGFSLTLVLAWYHGEQGRQRVSGPELLIIAGILAVSGLLVGVVFRGDAARRGPAGGEEASTASQSVAVLPFVNMSGDPDNEYFSDGVTEEILNAVAQLRGLRVPGRTSSFAFKGQPLTIREIADTLDVAHVLEGSVRRDGDRVLITAQLVDARSDAHLWSETFERELVDVFAIQREIAAAIADELRLTLAGGVEAARLAEGTQDTAAYTAYLRGRFYFNQRTVESLTTAIEEFSRATTLDPEYAEAWSGLADAHIVMVPSGISQGITFDPTRLRDHEERGLRAARRAVELAPDLGMTQASLGRALLDWGAWDDAEAAFLRAMELAPGYAPAHQWYGVFLAYTGRTDEGVESAREAVRLDPVSLIASWLLGFTLQLDGRWAEAAEQYRATIALDPGWPQAHVYLAQVLGRSGALDESRAALADFARTAGMPPALERTVLEPLVDAVERFHATGQPQRLPEPLRASPMGSGLATFALLIGDSEYVLASLTRGEASGQLLPGNLAAMYGLARSFSGPDGRLAPLFEDLRYQAMLERANIDW